MHTNRMSRAAFPLIVLLLAASCSRHDQRESGTGHPVRMHEDSGGNEEEAGWPHRFPTAGAFQWGRRDYGADGSQIEQRPPKRWLPRAAFRTRLASASRRAITSVSAP